MDSGEEPGRFGDKPWPGHRSTLCVNSNQSGRPFGMKYVYCVHVLCVATANTATVCAYRRTVTPRLQTLPCFTFDGSLRSCASNAACFCVLTRDGALAASHPAAGAGAAALVPPAAGGAYAARFSSRGVSRIPRWCLRPS